MTVEPAPHFNETPVQVECKVKRSSIIVNDFNDFR